MHIFMDKSGSFLQTGVPNSFSAEVAYVIPEDNLVIALAALRRFKKRAGRMPSEEVKATVRCAVVTQWADRARQWPVDVDRHALSTVLMRPLDPKRALS